MPEIIPNQNFKHGTETYEKGKPYEVSEGEAYYFEQVGWVGGEPKPTGETHDLEIQDVKVKAGSEVI